MNDGHHHRGVAVDTGSDDAYDWAPDEETELGYYPVLGAAARYLFPRIREYQNLLNAQDEAIRHYKALGNGKRPFSAVAQPTEIRSAFLSSELFAVATQDWPLPEPMKRRVWCAYDEIVQRMLLGQKAMQEDQFLYWVTILFAEALNLAPPTASAMMRLAHETGVKPLPPRWSRRSDDPAKCALEAARKQLRRAKNQIRRWRASGKVRKRKVYSPRPSSWRHSGNRETRPLGLSEDLARIKAIAEEQGLVSDLDPDGKGLSITSKEGEKWAVRFLPGTADHPTFVLDEPNTVAEIENHYKHVLAMFCPADYSRAKLIDLEGLEARLRRADNLDDGR